MTSLNLEFSVVRSANDGASKHGRRRQSHIAIRHMSKPTTPRTAVMLRLRQHLQNRSTLHPKPSSGSARSAGPITDQRVERAKSKIRRCKISLASLDEVGTASHAPPKWWEVCFRTEMSNEVQVAFLFCNAHGSDNFAIVTQDGLRKRRCSCSNAAGRPEPHEAPACAHIRMFTWALETRNDVSSSSGPSALHARRRHPRIREQRRHRPALAPRR